jgi:two-component system osmolarity sensor histidine kinase EnvZ
MSHDLQQLDADRALILAGVSHDLRTPSPACAWASRCAAPTRPTWTRWSPTSRTWTASSASSSSSRRKTAASAGPSTSAELADELTLYARRGFSLEVRANGPAWRGAPQALRRAVTNLIENAINYAGARPNWRSATPAEAAIHVLDRGPGIPASETERVKRPSPAWNPPQQHQGVGPRLAIVDRIVRGQKVNFASPPRRRRTRRLHPAPAAPKPELKLESGQPPLARNP